MAFVTVHSRFEPTLITSIFSAFSTSLKVVFPKAFCKKKRTAILNKPASYGFSVQLCYCSKSFLSDWHIVVGFDVHYSDFHSVNAGVP